MIPALTRPAPQSPAETARAAFWSLDRQTREARAAALGQAIEARQREHRTESLHAALQWLTAGTEASPGSLYNLWYLYRANRAGFFHQSLMYLYAVGYLLHHGHTREELEVLLPEDVKAQAADHKQGQRDANAAALAPAQQATREALTANVPDAPRHPVEQDALNLEALTVIEAKLPAVYRAAVHAAQTGDVGALDELGEAVRPTGYVAWLKQFGHDLVTGEAPQDGRIFDAHHVPIGEAEARSAVRPHVFAVAARENHIARPGAPLTAHHSDFSPRGDPAKLTALLYYEVIQHARWEAWTRGEPDPYPELPAYARMRP